MIITTREHSIFAEELQFSIVSWPCSSVICSWRLKEGLFSLNKLFYKVLFVLVHTSQFSELWQLTRAQICSDRTQDLEECDESNSSSSNEMKTCDRHDWPKPSQARPGDSIRPGQTPTWENEQWREEESTQHSGRVTLREPQNVSRNWPIQHWARQLNNVMDTLDLPLYEPCTPWHGIQA